MCINVSFPKKSSCRGRPHLWWMLHHLLDTFRCLQFRAKHWKRASLSAPMAGLMRTLCRTWIGGVSSELQVEGCWSWTCPAMQDLDTRTTHHCTLPTSSSHWATATVWVWVGRLSWVGQWYPSWASSRFSARMELLESYNFITYSSYSVSYLSCCNVILSMSYSYLQGL